MHPLLVSEDNKMIEFLLAWILQCILIPNTEEFGQCLDQVVLEYNQKQNEHTNVWPNWLL